MWRWAAQRGSRGAYVGVPLPDGLGLKRAPTADAWAPTWDQLDRVLLAPGPSWIRVLLIVLRCTGLRVAQGLHLQWSDVDPEHPMLTIRPELPGNKTKHEKRGRRVPLAPVLRDALVADWWPRGGAFLVPCPRERREARARDTRKMWNRAGIPEVDDPHHAIRSGFVSGLKALGADDEAVEVLVGHKLPGMRPHYLDPAALPLAAAVALVPPLPAVATLLP